MKRRCSFKLNLSFVETSPEIGDIGTDGEVGDGDFEFGAGVVYSVEPSAHGGVFALHTGKVDEEVAGLGLALTGLSLLEGIVPFSRLVYDLLSVFFFCKNPDHGVLFVVWRFDAQLDVWPEERQGGGFSEEIHGPFIDTKKEDAAIVAVPVVVAEEVDARESVGRRKESFPGYVLVENDGVGVNPAVGRNVLALVWKIGKEYACQEDSTYTSHSARLP